MLPRLILGMRAAVFFTCSTMPHLFDRDASGMMPALGHHSPPVFLPGCDIYRDSVECIACYVPYLDKKRVTYIKGKFFANRNHAITCEFSMNCLCPPYTHHALDFFASEPVSIVTRMKPLTLLLFACVFISTICATKNEESFNKII